MNALVIYDSMFGNTEKAAKIIGDVLGKVDKVKLMRVSQAKVDDLTSVGLLVIGSPTQGGQPTKKVQDFLGKIPKGLLNGVKVATFDTRLNTMEQITPLRLLMRTIGYASPKLAKQLQNKGGELISPPGYFIVTGKEGPLRDGENEQISQWAEQLTAA